MTEPEPAEVARVRLPVPIKGMDKLVQFLDRTYGKTYMYSVGEWLIFTTDSGASTDVEVGT